MRITDHRYTRDLLRFDLALRMIRHEARTCTIRLCTGLTDDRIRKLFRSYISTSPEGGAVRRKRGKSPQQIAFFTRNTFTQLEASLLAGIFAALGLFQHCRHGTTQRTLEFGELFCDAFETYQEVWRGSQLSFEHAWFLLSALASGEDLKVERCPVCRGAFVRDALTITPARCPLCRMRTDRGGGQRRWACRKTATVP